MTTNLILVGDSIINSFTSKFASTGAPSEKITGSSITKDANTLQESHVITTATQTITRGLGKINRSTIDPNGVSLWIVGQS